MRFATTTRTPRPLWSALRARRLGGWRWRRQAAFGPYILDFLCREAALVVELDGGQHADQLAYDARRTAWLERRGLTVIRFWNSAVLESREDVCDAILEACGGDHPNFEPCPPAAPDRGVGRLGDSGSEPKGPREEP